MKELLVIIIMCCFYSCSYLNETPSEKETLPTNYNQRSDSFIVAALDTIKNISYLKCQTSEYLTIYTTTCEILVYRNTTLVNNPSWRFSAYKASGRYSDYDYRVKGDNNLSDSTYQRLKNLMDVEAKRFKNG